MEEMAASTSRASVRSSRTRIRRVLLLGVRRDAMEHLAPQLKSGAVYLESVADAEAALGACLERPFALVIVRHPLAEMSIDEFLERLRERRMRSAGAFLLVLTEMASSEALSELSGPDVRFANLTDFAGILATVAEEALGVAPRASSRLMVELRMHIEGGSMSRFCQVVNLSATGMLVKSGDRIGVGEKVEIAFSLPDGTPPIRCGARVARRTDGREPIGFALAFRGLDPAARARIERFVGSQREST